MMAKTGSVIVVLMVLISLSITGVLDRWVGATVTARLNRQNDAYLSASFEKALSGFMVMSALKAGLDMIEGSEIGFSLGVQGSLQVGDVVQPAYDYVDIAWRTIFAGAVTLLATRYLLEAAALVDAGCLSVALSGFLLAYVLKTWRPKWRRLREMISDLGAFFMVLAIAAYLLLPLSVAGAARLSYLITRPAVAEAEQGMREVQQKIFPEAQTLDANLIGKVKELQVRMVEIASQMKGHTRDLAVWAFKVVAGYLFDCILFPVMLFGVLVWLTRKAAAYAFETKRTHAFQEALSDIMHAKPSDPPSG